MVTQEEEFPMDMDDEEDFDNETPQQSDTYYDSLDSLVVAIADYAEAYNLNPIKLRQKLFEETLRTLSEQHGVPFDNLILSFEPSDAGYKALLVNLYPALQNVIDSASNAQNKSKLIELLNEALNILNDEEVPEPVAPVKAEPEKKVNEKLRYIKQLMDKGFKPITNNTDVVGKTGMHDTLVGLMKSFYTPSPVLDYKDKVYMVNQTLLESYKVNPKNVDIWQPETYMLDEDLMFRIFNKEDDISFTILIKLPVAVTNFSFKGSRESELEALPLLFSNMNSSYGQVFTSSLLKSPRVCNLGTTRQISCGYDCIEIKLSKDLLAFKNSNWSLRDYIAANKGKQTQFSSFDNLSLGEKIVVGVMPGDLKAERFDSSGKYNVSAIVGGGAGSGKTAMYDSLLVQMLALEGDFGNGATILMDAKQEWIPVWKPLFKQLGIPFYGFDGGVLEPSEVKWRVDKKGSQVVEQIPTTVQSYVGGILFTRVIYETIQVILSATGCSDIEEFNKGNFNYKGITRIPRTGILVDELNTLYANLNNDKVFPKELYKGLILARLTRTSGFLWFLGGQDPSRTVIQSDERSNYGYNIMGKMGSDRYEYFNVVQNKAVVDYEEKNRTQDNPNPILTQGMFYAGPQGKTDLVKCLFLPKNERLDALQDLQSTFDGMHELDKIVKLALKDGLFDKLQVTIKTPNNIIYAALKHLGVLSQQEFDYYSDRVLNGVSDEHEDSLNDTLEGNFSDSDFESNLNTFTGESPNHQNPQSGNLVTGDDDDDFYDEMPDDADVYQDNGDMFEEDVNQFNQPSQPRTPEQEVVEQPYTPPSQRSGYLNTYSEPMNLPQNPFQVHGRSGSPISAINSIRMFSNYILADIKRFAGDLDRIESFEVTTNGLVINNIAFRPTFTQDVIDSMPFDIKQQVQNGNIIELFHFENIKKFRNLAVLRIDNSRLAEGRVRREIGLHPNKTWFKLFDKFRNLRELYIGGQRIVDEPTAQHYDDDGRGGFSLTEKLRNTFGMGASVLSSSRMDKVWDSKPVRVIGGAAGWTVGIKAVTLAATFLGPWGLIFGAFAGYGALKGMQNRRDR